MKNKLKQGKVLLALAVILLIVVSVTGYFQFNELTVTRQRLSQQEQRLTSLSSNLDSLEYIVEEGNLEEHYILFKEIIPDSPRKDKLIDLLYDSVPVDGGLKQIRVESVEHRDRYSSVPVSFSYGGRYGEVIQLINSINEDHRMMKILDIDIYEGAEGYPQVNADIYAEVFFAKISH